MMPMIVSASQSPTRAWHSTPAGRSTLVHPVGAVAPPGMATTHRVGSLAVGPRARSASMRAAMACVHFQGVAVVRAGDAGLGQAACPERINLASFGSGQGVGRDGMTVAGWSCRDWGDHRAPVASTPPGNRAGPHGATGSAAGLTIMVGLTGPVDAHDMSGEGRIAVVTAFAPEQDAILSDLELQAVEAINGVEFYLGTLEGRNVVLFQSGIGMVNAAMTMQLALDIYPINAVIVSGTAGGVDPSLDIGDVVIADRWGQYLEVLIARKVEEDWAPVPFFEYPYVNFGMLFPRSLTVTREGSTEPETRFWFPVHAGLFAAAGRATSGLELEHCIDESRCLEHVPKVVFGGTGVSGGAFVGNAEFRDCAFGTFAARVLDMESAAVAHVAWANTVPFIAIRSLADLAGGSDQANQVETFMGLATRNAATIVKVLLRKMRGVE